MATATTKKNGAAAKPAAPKSPPKPDPLAPKVASIERECAELRETISGLATAVRRLANGAVVTEEHRNEIEALISGA